MSKSLAWLAGANAATLILCAVLGGMAYDLRQQVTSLEFRVANIAGEVGKRPSDSSPFGVLSIWDTLNFLRKDSANLAEPRAIATAARVSAVESDLRVTKLEVLELWNALGGKLTLGQEVRVNCFKNRTTARIECREL